ncbi:phosphotransferase family protein [Fredinandcohnia sp. 179-A 10B2 NHS]|uniref:phosphotransferase family protein n=1 Tax=Fredinandcohnia sp. 179-A 10B2 NHS TaxID=3235176 RepID=UPI0039A2B721
MDVENILKELGLSSVTKVQQIHGGQDSSVWKVETANFAYALRVLPGDHYEQFVREQKVIQLAQNNGIPVPNVVSVFKGESYCAMLMEWAKGHTVFEELQRSPDNASQIGKEFGRMQALIHAISVDNNFEDNNENFLTPVTDLEKSAMNLIEKYYTLYSPTLLHLDYHPLNILTDGEKITAVIDWANASAGDYRFDFARTFSILRLEGTKYFDKKTFEEFESGWLIGYFSFIGMIPADPIELFNVWAGDRMLRDLSGKLSKTDLDKLSNWTLNWVYNFVNNYKN